MHIHMDFFVAFFLKVRMIRFFIIWFLFLFSKHFVLQCACINFSAHDTFIHALLSFKHIFGSNLVWLNYSILLQNILSISIVHYNLFIATLSFKKIYWITLIVNQSIFPTKKTHVAYHCYVPLVTYPRQENNTAKGQVRCFDKKIYSFLVLWHVPMRQDDSFI